MSDDANGRERRTRLWRPGPREAADREIRHHVEERVDRLVAEGWDEDAARAEARRRFGDVARIRREMTAMGRRDAGTWTVAGWLESVAQDVRYTLRSLGKRPGWAGTLVATLGIGIGAGAAIFAVADALMLRPLPYRDADRLVSARLRMDGAYTVTFVAADQVEPWTAGADFLDAVALHDHVGLVRTDGPEPENIRAIAASHGLDDLLGAPLRLGRGFLPGDAEPGTPGVAVLTHGYWARTGSDPDVLGRTLRMNDRSYTVVGVLERGFKYPVGGDIDLWIPLADDLTAGGRTLDRVEVLGRLREDVTLEAARDRAEALGRTLASEQPHRYGWDVALTPVTSWRANADVRHAMWMLMGAVGLMLLIATVNVVNLLLARGTARRREMGVRAAMGAPGGRILRQVVTESVVVALMAGLLSVGLAWLGVEGMSALMPEELRWSSVYEFTVGRRTLVLTFALSTGVGLLLGLLPAFQAAHQGWRTAGGLVPRGGGRRGELLRNAFVAVQVALSVALLAGAGLLGRSLVRLVTVDPGFEPDRLVYLEFSLSETRYPTGVGRADFFRRVEEEIEALPAVDAAVLADGLPGSTGFSFGVRLQAEGAEPPGAQPDLLPMAAGAPDYADVLGIRLRRGRGLEADDVGLRRAVIDASFARFLWGDADPVGRRFRTSGDSDWWTVVGVTEELRLYGMDDRPGALDMIMVRSDSTARPHMAMAVRTRSAAEDVLPLIRRAVHRVDPHQPVRELHTARAALADSIEKPRFLATLMAVLAGVAATLAATGVYGVLAYAVSLRRKELGIRVALGAPLARVRRGVVRRGLAWAALGVLAGLGLARVLDRLVESLLYEVRPGDPWTLGAVTALMLAVAALACQVPARRATRVDPVEVLQAD